MKINLSTILLITVIVVWIIQPLVMIFTGRKTLKLLLLKTFASTIMIYGAIAFFSFFLSASGNLDFLSKSFEWPVGTAKNVLKTEEELYIVPHIPSGRIQIYDKDIHFIRGWVVNAAGGYFRLSNLKNNDFIVYTARGNNKFIYDIE